MALSLPCGEHKLRNFKARDLTMKQTIREYSCFGQFGTMTVNHFDFVEFKFANFPKLEYSRMVCFIVKSRALKLRNLCSPHG